MMFDSNRVIPVALGSGDGSAAATTAPWATISARVIEPAAPIDPMSGRCIERLLPSGSADRIAGRFDTSHRSELPDVYSPALDHGALESKTRRGPHVSLSDVSSSVL